MYIHSAVYDLIVFMLAMLQQLCNSCTLGKKDVSDIATMYAQVDQRPKDVCTILGLK